MGVTSMVALLFCVSEKVLKIQVTLRQSSLQFRSLHHLTLKKKKGTKDNHDHRSERDVARLTYLLVNVGFLCSALHGGVCFAHTCVYACVCLLPSVSGNNVEV